MSASDWQEFERFAAEFLAVEFPSLRTMASAAGDKGRDGELFRPDEAAAVAVQYSVAKDWADKIRRTVRRLADTLPDITQLVYATSQVVGPGADTLVGELRREFNLFLDVRDRSWFVERELTAPQREAASEELATRFVDPLLTSRGLKERPGRGMLDGEAGLALLHLALETRDEASQKGLTKSTFEALTLAALHDTDSDNRLPAGQVVQRVRAFLPAGHETQVDGLVIGALGRLSGRGGRVKLHSKTRDYCLSHPEVVALRDRIAGFIGEEVSLESELVKAVEAAGAKTRLHLSDEDWEVVGRDLRSGVETVLLNRGESFAVETMTGDLDALDVRKVFAAIAQAGRSPANQLTDDEAAFAVVEVLDRPSPAVRAHLRRLADAYTLFAFLRQTPDVQKVILTMFSEGDLWIDSSIVLPLIAETLIDDPTQRHYTVLMRAALDAGLHLYVTDGVVEEVERHLNRCVAFARLGNVRWRGPVPFVQLAYTLSGRALADVHAWLEEFRGLARPVEDLKLYLSDTFGIEHRDLKDYSDPAPVELRGAVQEVWNEAHQRRRGRSDDELDSATKARLVEHDVENSVGIMELRRRSESAPLGHRAWWLTMDKIAFTLTKQLRVRLGSDAPVSPALSPDFLSQFLRLGPLRTAVERDLRVNLPIVAGISRMDFVPNSLIEQAASIRAQHTGVSERVLQRRVRDALDEARAAVGPETLAGFRVAEERVRARLQAQELGH